MSFFGKLSQFLGADSSKTATSTPKSTSSKALPSVPVEPLQPKNKLAVPASDRPTLPSQPTAADDQSIRDAQAKVREILVEARGEAIKIREQAEAEARRARQSLTDQQRTLDQKLNSLDQKLSSLDRKEEDAEKLRESLQQEIDSLKKNKEQVAKKLESVAKMTTEEAKEFLFKNLQTKLSKEIAVLVRQKEEETKQIADVKAREIIVEAMKHGTVDFVPEYTVSVVKLPDEEVKGRIIGKGGRNIHTFERSTGVDVDLDGAPTEV
jgi:ribonuclease Y